MLLPLKTRDKSINFCGTTQIDDKSPALLRTTMRILLVTARNPVSAYSPKGFGLPSQGHSESALRPHSHHRRLSLHTFGNLLFLLNGLPY